MCFLPAGIIAAVLVMFPLHWIVMINLGGWGIDPVIELRDPKSLKNIELFLQAAFGPLAFIYFAARTAPNHKQTCSVLLAGIIVIGLPILTYSWNANTISKEGIGAGSRHLTFKPSGFNFSCQLRPNPRYGTG